MELPPTVLPESVRSMQTSVWTGTHSVTGDAFDTPFAPAAATLNASNSPPPPHTTSEANFATASTAARPAARRSILRRQSLQSVTQRLYEAAEFVASFDASISGAPEASVAVASRAAIDEASRHVPPMDDKPTKKRIRKRRRQTCCPDTTGCTTAVKTTDHMENEATTPVAVVSHENEAFSLQPSLQIGLQFDAVFQRLTDAVTHLADIATSRASKLCVMRDVYNQKDADQPTGHALNADVDTELGIVSALSNVASDLMRLQHLWTTATEYHFVPYDAITLSVAQLLRDANDAADSEATTSSAEPFLIQFSEPHRRKNKPRKLRTDEQNLTSTDSNKTPIAQPEEEYGDVAAKLDKRQ